MEIAGSASTNKSRRSSVIGKGHFTERDSFRESSDVTRRSSNELKNEELDSLHDPF